LLSTGAFLTAVQSCDGHWALCAEGVVLCDATLATVHDKFMIGHGVTERGRSCRILVGRMHGARRGPRELR